MLNYIWLGLIVVAVLLGGYNDRLGDVTSAAFDSARFAVMNLALPLAGVIALWLGIMRLAELSGLVQVIARAIRPLMTRLFPEVPANHPAMGAMIMNMSANMIGLGNAATPLGLRAMMYLEKLNPHPGTASNAMCTFLALNTSSVTIIPATAMALLAGGGASNPAIIVGTALGATICSTITAIVAVKTLQRLPVFQLPPALPAEGTAETEGGAGETASPEPKDEPPVLVEAPPMPGWGPYLLWGLVLFFVLLFAMQYSPALAEQVRGYLPQVPVVEATDEEAAEAEEEPAPALVRAVQAIGILAIPFILCFFPLYAALRGVRVYEEFVEGAKEGIQVAIRIIPFLVAILVAMSMFRDSGGMELLQYILAPVLNLIRFPVELLPMALIRPLSGGGATGMLGDIIQRYGGDHFLSLTAATMQGSTETTLYVLAVYFGSVGIRRARHALPAGLIADAVGIIAAVIICRLVFL